MSVYDRAHELARMLRESGEYQEYTRARQAIGTESTARSILIDYRKNQIQIQAARLAGKEPPGQAVKELERLGGIIDMHKPISDFLRAENRLLTLLADIQKILGQSLDLWDYDEVDTGA
ncbi:MAG: YlbF family regulator [Ignavibacteriales bacterium]